MVPVCEEIRGSFAKISICAEKLTSVALLCGWGPKGVRLRGNPIERTLRQDQVLDASRTETHRL
jgi:hypothetical protein